MNIVMRIPECVLLHEQVQTIYKSHAQACQPYVLVKRDCDSHASAGPASHAHPGDGKVVVLSIRFFQPLPILENSPGSISLP